MDITGIIIGTRLEMEIYDNYYENIVPAVTSQFELAIDKKTAIIAAPIFQGTLYPVRLGWYLKVHFNFKDDLYKFEAKVVHRVNKNNLSFLKIELVGDIIKIQRRENFRFECNVPVKYRLMHTIHKPENESGQFMEGLTRDLSGGGLCIKLAEELHVSKLIECELKLREDMSVKFIGEIVRFTPRIGELKYKHEIGVTYKQIDIKEKETIIRFIFEEQRKLRKKGLI